ncbi:prepilin-type N-terminal cleavage/methylation domain-containing protein [Puniceicoccaceae bacterium K14]|nr:prepilin-type N-terminal cleavage/methylation domain-containing protein [Puniceicoccaceae bacterium K14]
MTGNRFRVSGFTLLEVVVAMALFALISIPTIALMTMTARKSDARLGVGKASELIALIDAEVTASFRSGGINNGQDLETTPLTLYASEFLDKFAFNGVGFQNSEKYYRIKVTEPTGYSYSQGDAYRIFVYKVIWPAFVESGGGNYASNESTPANLEELVSPSVVLVR